MELTADLELQRQLAPWRLTSYLEWKDLLLQRTSRQHSMFYLYLSVTVKQQF
jgi:hypothetical protein